MKLITAGHSLPVVEEKFITLDGREIFVETSAAPFWYKGKPAVQLIVKDITEQKEAVQAVRKTETLFGQLFQNSPFAIVMLDDKGNVTRVNKGFEEMFGFTLTELVGKGLNQFIVPNELENEGNDLNSIISNQSVVRTDTVRLRKDGTFLSVIIYGVPVMLEDKTIGIFGVYVDITERKKVEEELKVRNAELDNFVYKVSHDLRAPLSSVLGLVNLAMLPGNDDNLMDYLKIIGQKIGQLDNFINDVLSHSKNLKMDMKIGKVDFQKIIDQTFTNLNYQKGADQVKREVAVKADGFFNDPWRISEIFRNLISNAIKYRKLDIPVPSIHILVRSDESKAEIVFKDNGIGIDSDNVSHIFDMFYRASEQSDGSGLGLYIVKNAVDKLGGSITVESKLGEGTVFTITLPNLQH
jgi:PAS domain S-box-containing protein